MQAAAGTAPKYVHDRACTRGGKRANARRANRGSVGMGACGAFATTEAIVTRRIWWQ